MKAGEINQPIRTDLGFHLPFCSDIKQEQTLAIKTVADDIRDQLFTARIQQAQRDWICNLDCPRK